MSSGNLSRAERRARFRRRVREAIRKADDEFRGKYRKEIKDLMGLSRAQIDAISPGTTDIETYNKLITIVKEASRVNLAQADLKAQIKQLGQVAVDIAKKVPSLAKILATGV